jgi:hypothetical protein
MKKSIIKGIFALSIFSSALVACKKINPTEGVEQIVDATFSKSTVSLQFVDAKTGVQLDLTGAEDVKISVVGEDASSVVTNLATTQFAADFGISALALRDGVVPSTSNVVEFTVSATANGYLPASKAVSIVQEGHQHYEVKMIKISDAPVGVSVDEAIISAVPSTGVLAADFSLSPAQVTSTGTTVAVNIPQGTKLKDKNNAAVGGNVTTTLAYFNPLDSEFSSAFPSLLQYSTLTTGQHVAFNTVGMLAMEMNSSNGKEIKNFGSPISMMMQIPDGATNEDGTAIQTGDSFDVLSYDEETAEWKVESTVVTVLNGATGKLEVNFEMTHLSRWQVANTTQMTSGKTYYEVTYQGSCADYFNNTKDIIVEYDDGVQNNYSENAVISIGQKTFLIGTNTIWPVTKWPNAKFRWYRKSNPSDKVEVPATLGTGPQTVTFPSSWCPPAPPKNFTIKLTTSCPDKPDRKVKPQCLVMALPLEGGNMKIVGMMMNGELKTSTSVLENGKKYCLMTFYNDKLVALQGTLSPFNPGSITIDGNDIDLSRPLTSTECTYLRKITG